MSFSKNQQPEFRTLVFAAWAAECKRDGRQVTAKPDRDWYEQALYRAVRKTSTTECDAGHDYDFVMAHFEALAGVSIKWQMRVYSGDVKRILWWLQKDCGDADLRRLGVNEDYLLRMVRSGYGQKKPWELEKEERQTILGEVKRWVRRDMAHARHIAEEKAEAMGLGEPEHPF